MKTVLTGGMVLLAMVSCVFGGMADTGVRGGYMRFSDEDSGAVLGGLFFRSDWRSVVFVDGSLYYHTKEISNDVDLELIPFQLSAMLFLLGRDGVLSPFVLGGGGLYWQRLTDGNDSKNEFDFGWHLGFGADYALSRRMFIEADFRYIWLNASNKGQTVADKLSDFNHWIGTIGLGFRL